MPIPLPSRIEIHSDVIEVIAGEEIRGNELWFAHQAEVRAALEKLEHAALVINMREVQMINSLGVASILRYYKAVLAVGGVFGMVCVGAMIQGVLEMLGLKGKLGMYRDLDAFRVRALGQSPPAPQAPAPSEDSAPPAPKPPSPPTTN